MSYVFKVGDKGKTRDGRDYEIMLIDPSHHRPVVAKIQPRPCSAYPEKYVTYHVSGKMVSHPKEHWASDLTPPIEYVWVNWYKHVTLGTNCAVFRSEDSATSAWNAIKHSTSWELLKLAVKTEVPTP